VELAGACAHCGGPTTSTRARFCSPRCRKRGWRRRHAGLGEDSYAGNAGAHRGPVKLGAATSRELAALVAQERTEVTDEHGIARIVMPGDPLPGARLIGQAQLAERAAGSPAAA